MFLEPTGLFVAHALELFVAQFLVAHLANKLGGTQQGKHCFLSYSFRFDQYWVLNRFLPSLKSNALVFLRSYLRVVCFSNQLAFLWVTLCRELLSAFW
jgi:hypothetical protein